MSDDEYVNHTYTFDAPATVTLHVEADSEQEAWAKVRAALGAENPDIEFAPGVIVHELAIGEAHVDWSVAEVALSSGPADTEDDGGDDPDDEVDHDSTR
ncbi:hypothetical protein [Micromonospora sp. NPDC047730]|uniref:hypothetical protein n=1 Tax=Micromonospora sp. NPDC047730 TaxID=3364253 RepID=UPI0037228D77